MVFVPYLIRDRKAGQAFLDGHFHFHVPFIVCFEANPFLAVVLWEIAGSAAVCFGCLAWRAEEADQFFSFF